MSGPAAGQRTDNLGGDCTAAPCYPSQLTPVCLRTTDLAHTASCACNPQCGLRIDGSVVYMPAQHRDDAISRSMCTCYGHAGFGCAQQLPQLFAHLEQGSKRKGLASGLRWRWQVKQAHKLPTMWGGQLRLISIAQGGQGAGRKVGQGQQVAEVPAVHMYTAHHTNSWLASSCARSALHDSN